MKTRQIKILHLRQRQVRSDIWCHPFSRILGREPTPVEKSVIARLEKARRQPRQRPIVIVDNEGFDSSALLRRLLCLKALKGRCTRSPTTSPTRTSPGRAEVRCRARCGGNDICSVQRPRRGRLDPDSSQFQRILIRIINCQRLRNCLGRRNGFSGGR